MTTKNSLVKTMFMSILTAGVFAFSFSSCSDELDAQNASADNQQAPEGTRGELLEAYGLPLRTSTTRATFRSSTPTPPS